MKSVIARVTRDNLFPANVPKTIEESFYVEDGHEAEDQFEKVVEFKQKGTKRKVMKSDGVPLCKWKVNHPALLEPGTKATTF